MSGKVKIKDGQCQGFLPAKTTAIQEIDEDFVMIILILCLEDCFLFCSRQGALGCRRLIYLIHILTDSFVDVGRIKPVDHSGSKDLLKGHLDLLLGPELACGMAQE